MLELQAISTHHLAYLVFHDFRRNRTTSLRCPPSGRISKPPRGDRQETAPQTMGAKGRTNSRAIIALYYLIGDAAQGSWFSSCPSPRSLSTSLIRRQPGTSLMFIHAFSTWQNIAEGQDSRRCRNLKQQAIRKIQLPHLLFQHS